MKGKKILVIDLDPQGNATTGLGLSNKERKSFFAIFPSIQAIIVPTKYRTI